MNIGKEITLGGGSLAQCHLMPCRIEFAGPQVKAKEYFWPTIRSLEEGGDEEQGREVGSSFINQRKGTKDEINGPILAASFRGRPLQGRKISLPQGYQGYVVQDSKSFVKFKEFTYWNWDEIPSDKDSAPKSLRWINISKGIHDA